jgi:hypothetical protein
MDDFKINVSRIEMVGRSGKNTEVCVTFKFERGPIVFQIPLFLEHEDFDDTEMIKAARSILHDIFTHLTMQCETWRLTGAELEDLKNLNLRPGGPKDAS